MSAGDRHAFRGREKPLRAVFLNYLLDCLPAAVLNLEEEQVRELHVRTCVARSVKLADYTDLTPEQLPGPVRQRPPSPPSPPTTAKSANDRQVRQRPPTPSGSREPEPLAVKAAQQRKGILANDL